MAGIGKHFVTESTAYNVRAPTEGFADVTTSTTVEYVDLTEYAGHYVTVSVSGEAHYVAFGPDGSFTMDVDAATAGTSYVAFPMAVDTHRDWVVSKDNPYLAYRTQSGTGEIRVHKA